MKLHLLFKLTAVEMEKSRSGSQHCDINYTDNCKMFLMLWL